MMVVRHYSHVRAKKIHSVPGHHSGYYTCQPRLRIADLGWLESSATRVHVNRVKYDIRHSQTSHDLADNGKCGFERTTHQNRRQKNTQYTKQIEYKSLKRVYTPKL